MIDRKIKYAIVSGGGAKSDLYKKIISSMLNLDIYIIDNESSSLGAAILAMVACNEYENVDLAIKNIIKYKEKISPNKDWVKKYNEGYIIYKKIYNNLKEVFKEIK